jgi:hypothetical protein
MSRLSTRCGAAPELDDKALTERAAEKMPDPGAGSRVQSSMAYRDDLTALAARHDALAQEVEQKTRELEESRRLLEQAQAHWRLPVLDNLRVASPCTADWSQMTGDERTRHCGDCKKDVYNLSGMTRDEAEALLVERAGNLCVRYYQRHDGTILLADCTVGARRRRRRRWIAAGAATLLAGSAGVGAALQRKPQCEPVTQLTADDGVTWMGELRTPDPVPEPPPPVVRAEVPAGTVTMGAVRLAPAELKRIEDRMRALEERKRELLQARTRELEERRHELEERRRELEERRRELNERAKQRDRRDHAR